MKYLRFDVKRNLNRSPRIYVKSLDLKVTYGTFPSDQPSQFDGWNQLSEDQTIELKQYIQNLNTVKQHLGILALNEQTDYRLRLPNSFIEAVNAIHKLCEESSLELDIFEPILSAIVQQIKIVVAKLPIEPKTKALSILDHLGLAEYKKMDYSRQIQAIFSELISIPNKSEKLHETAKKLFEKDKSYSPRAIEGMAKGETAPSKWLVACAIEILAAEKLAVLKTILSEDDIFMLWAKPLVDHDKKDVLTHLINQHHFSFLNDRVCKYFNEQK